MPSPTPEGKVEWDYLKKVELKNKTEATYVGRFQSRYLYDLSEDIGSETFGDIDIFCVPPDQNRTGAGLIVVKLRDNPDVCFGLAGLQTHQPDIENVTGIKIPKQPDTEG